MNSPASRKALLRNKQSLATTRLAERDDVPAIHALLTDLAATLDETDAFRAREEDLVKGGFGTAPAFHVILAEIEAQPVGITLFFRTFSSWRGQAGLYIQDLHVVEACRGMGYGRLLLSAAASFGRQSGCTHLRLSVAVANAAGRSFYRRIGMQERDDEIICQIADSAFDRLTEEFTP
ncbi:MAG: GNAT family N-acetyltransferase [Pseudomonadota bacterium]